ncbi:stage V sporulation protein D [Clostridium thermobutyricum]|uniref:Stage V sporulation protein D n=2 Tax=Clostridium TaxID=1485 RepID=A0A1V4SVF4_9CLOT|nr:stage V sporulation protein D [Clostridium thermobutyricum]OPX47959.1 stage V sporulation protein D [Clostridium thermobutyricum DSM 4928]
MKKRKFVDRALTYKRMRLFLIVLTLIFAFLSFRLAYIMVIQHEKLSAGAEEQWTSEVKIDARRGRILDRNGRELAVSANVYRVDFDLNSIRKYIESKDTTLEAISEKISEAVGMENKDVLKKLNTKLPSGKNAGSATLIRRIEKEPADKVRALNINGVIVSPDTKRYYPNNNFAAHVLGSTNIDGQGLTGIELQYNEELSGVPGMKISEMDATGSDLPYTISKFTPPVNGSDVTLTIDENIQFFAEKAAEKALADNKAKSVSVTVMDPNTGEILALTNKDDFDPNEPFKGAENFSGSTEFEKVQKMWRNKVVNDTFEPGSIFKVITSAAAMEEGLVKETDTFVCNGSLKYGNRAIKCWKTGGHGTLTFPEIIQNSCNVGFMELGKRIGKEKLYEYIKKFGLGQVSGVDLPGEAKGIVKHPKNMSETDLATISFGQTNTVNPIQFLTAINAVANGGKLIQPHVMKEINRESSEGVVVNVDTFKPKTKQIISEAVTTELRKHMERVVLYGSAKNAAVEGYTIAGKTGTAQKVIDGKYAPQKYISSFIGMAPVDNPKVTVMITIDEPSNGQYYAGVVTSPVAKGLFTDIFNYMENSFSKENNSAIIKDVIIPEIREKSLEEAKTILKKEKIDYNIEGNGDTVVGVSPYPGYAVKEGTKINIYTEENNTKKNAVVMPNVVGYTKESASEILSKLGISYNFKGEGTVSKQSIPSGELINKGTTVDLTLNS